MAADQKAKSKLNDLLDFGPESTPTPTPSNSNSFTDRLKQVVKKLQELNERIDQLSNRFE